MPIGRESGEWRLDGAGGLLLVGFDLAEEFEGGILDGLVIQAAGAQADVHDFEDLAGHGIAAIFGGVGEVYFEGRHKEGGAQIVDSLGELIVDSAPVGSAINYQL
jgi:hypothetical protein